MILYYSIISLLLVIIYVSVQVCLIYFWLRKERSIMRSDFSSRVSVVVALRNEAENISSLLQSLLNQDYDPSKFEIILVDNHSNDGTLSLLRKYTFTVPRLMVIDLSDILDEHHAYKKEALNAGIQQATGDIVLTTDADCKAGPSWISTMVNEMESRDLNILTGPVSIYTASQFLEQYQQIDLSGLLVATGGGIRSGLLLMGNGANLAFRRDVYLQIGGYDKMPSYSSGDDVFLLQAIDNISPKKVGFVKKKSAIVWTGSIGSWQHFFQQRKRWASKASSFRHRATRGVAIVVTLNSLLICLHFLLTIIVGLPFLYFLVVHLIAKMLIDSWMISSGLKFIAKKADKLTLFISHLINPVINVWVFLIIILSRKYRWKDRITH